MSSVPLILPVRAADAIALADIIFDAAERRPFRDDVRNRIAARLNAERFDRLTPHPGSLAEDPVHASAFFIAVDSTDSAPHLLRIALASAPASALFPNPILITRSRSRAGREIVVNAIPFAASNVEEVRKFAAHVDPSFLPRAAGAQPVLTVEAASPETQLPAAFQAFRRILRTYGARIAAVDGERALDAAIWSAVRAGWREGFAACARIPLRDGLEIAQQAALRRPLCSRFTVVATPAQLELVPRLHAFIAETRSSQSVSKQFDLELSLEGSGAASPDAVAECLESLKPHGPIVQAIQPEAGPWSETGALAEAVRPYNVTLTIAARADATPLELERLGRAAAGRLNYRLPLPAHLDADAVAEAVVETAACLYG
ncbi:MAG: hypothetical protein JSU00_24890 [Acidobacteria bacterium]|nr:hypothetical protein [Acidobacteriota bacterium]